MQRCKLQGPDKEGNFILRGLFHSDMASYHIWKFQSRRSLLVWNIYGKRLDGWSNDDIPSETFQPNDSRRQKVRLPGNLDAPADQRMYLGDIDYTGQVMPPPASVAGTYKGADGNLIKVEPLSDEDRRTIVRWIDLGCPIDLDPQYRPKDLKSGKAIGLGDDARPTLTMTFPGPGKNGLLTRILIGMHDYRSDLDMKSLHLSADFAIDGAPAGVNLASRLQSLAGHRWEWKLTSPIQSLDRGKLTLTVRDLRGNHSRVERSISTR